MKKESVRFTLQIPKRAAEFLDEIAAENFTSRNAEVVRSIRERMAATGEGLDNSTPAAVKTGTVQGADQSTNA